MDRRSRCFAICVVFLSLMICIFITTTLMLLLAYMQTSSPPVSTTCVVSDYQHLGAELLGKMSKTHKPCHDWYGFSCGGYDANAEATWSVLQRYGRRVYSDLVRAGEKIVYDLLAKRPPYVAGAGNHSWIDSVKIFFESCMKASIYGSTSRVKHVTAHWKSFNYSDAESMKSLTLNAVLDGFAEDGIPVLFQVHSAKAVSKNRCPIFRKDDHTLCISFINPVLYLLKDVHSLTATSTVSMMEQWNAILRRTLARFRRTSPVLTFLRKYVDQTVRLHFEISKLYHFYATTHGHFSDPNLTDFNPVGVKMLNNSHLDAHFVKVERQFRDRVGFVKDKLLIYAMYNLLQKKPKDHVIAYYTLDSFLRMNLILPNNMRYFAKGTMDILSAKMKALVYDGYGFGESSNNKRRCIHLAYGFFRDGFREFYLERPHSKKQNETAYTVYTAVKETLHDEVDSAKWLDVDAQTNMKTLFHYTEKKLDKLFKVGLRKKSISFPDPKDFSPDDLLKNINLLWKHFLSMGVELAPPTSRIICYSDDELFRVFVLDGLLFDSVIHWNYPSYWNFAVFGYFVGYEYGYQLETNEASSMKGLDAAFADSESESVYLIRRQCFLKLFASLKNVSLVSEQPFLASSIADYIGVRAAFKALQKFMTNEKRVRVALDRVTSYSYNQLFFITVTQNWCEKMSKTYEEIFYVSIGALSGYTSPGRYRATALIHYMPELHTVFFCEKRKYDDGKVCKIW